MSHFKLKILLVGMIILGVVLPIFSQAAGVCRWHADRIHSEGQADSSNPPLTEAECARNAPQMYWDPTGAPPPLPQCSDGIDNDGDGLIDAADPGCHIDNNPSNPASYDRSYNNETWVSATQDESAGPKPYKLLAPFTGAPGFEDTFDPRDDNALGRYLNTMLRIFIGLAGVFAVIMLVIGGMEYMTSELMNTKEHGREIMTNAIFGLVIALGSYALLNTINPTLLRTDIEIPKVTFEFEEGEEIIVGAGVVCGITLSVNGQGVTSCDESQIVGTTFMGHNVRINRAIVANVQAIESILRNSTDPLVKNYQIRTVGSYNARSAINSNPPKPSAHAFGLALDINASTNGYSNAPTPCLTDMPRSFVNIFTSRGFGWGGYWTTKKDAMHFSMLPGEAANYLTGSCDGLTR